MLYQFMSFPDGTEINHSELLENNSVRIYIEQWNDLHDDFDSLEIYFPGCKITKIVGFTEEQVKKHCKHLSALQDVLLECAAEKDGN